MSDTEIIPHEHVQSCILVLRGQRVLLDSDLAALYGVPTKRLNEQIRRNSAKFPADFTFQLTSAEAAAVFFSRSQNATLKRGQNVKYLPFAFTEYGALMVASVLNSPRAITMSVQIIRAFVRLRQLLVNHKALAAKLAELDTRVGGHDEQLSVLVKTIRQLAAPPVGARRKKIGFHQGNR